MASDADIISALPLLSWGGLAAPPYDLVTGEWENHLAPRRVPYVPGELHDDTGRGAFPMTARLYFTNGLSWAQPGVPRLFPEYWEQWRPLLLDGDVRDLVHPVLGPMRARVKGAKFELRASVRSGVVVDVSWLETVENPADVNLNGYLTTNLPVAGLAADADAAAAAWGIAPGDGLPIEVLEARYGATFDGETADLVTIFDAIRPEVFAGTVRALSLITSLMGDVAAMVDALESRDSAFTFDAYDKLVAFYLACDAMRRGLGRSARRTATFVATGRTTLDAVATRVGNSLKDVMGLNLSLLRRPYVERGTPVVYYLAA